MAPPTLYQVPASPPVRAVLITAKAIGLTLNEKLVDLTNGEHLTPDYVKINPQHTVPTLDDAGFIVWDSHAIIHYIVAQYGKNSTLVPSEPKLRAVVEQRLHFDSSVLFSALRNAVRPVFMGVRTTIAEEAKAGLEEAYAFLEAFIAGKQWAAGDVLTIADYSLIATVTSANEVVAIGAQKYPNLTKWVAKVKALPEYAANEAGLKSFATLLASKLQ